VNKEKIAIIVGTRPEAIKLAPLCIALREDDFEVTVVGTGQHTEMIAGILEFFGVRIDITLDITRKTGSLSELSSELLMQIEKVLLEVRPSMVLVQGDTTSAYIGALCAFYLKIPVGHVEAGLRTDEKYSPFPEEINRRLISEITDLHFAPTQTAAKNLEPKQHVFVTGNTVIDALLLAKKTIAESAQVYQEKYRSVLNPGNRNVLITGHRRESIGEGFRNIFQAINELAHEFSHYNFVYPVHLNPNVREAVSQYLEDRSNIFLLDPIPYDHLLFCLSRSYLVLTDSGGIQEEAPSFNIPVIVMRNHTERMEGVEANCAILAGTQKQAIVETFRQLMHDQELYERMQRAENPYGDGNTSNRIVKAIKEIIPSRVKKKNAAG